LTEDRLTITGVTLATFTTTVDDYGA
jgi:hypothetical protein